MVTEFIAKFCCIHTTRGEKKCCLPFRRNSEVSSNSGRQCRQVRNIKGSDHKASSCRLKQPEAFTNNGVENAANIVHNKYSYHKHPLSQSLPRYVPETKEGHTVRVFFDYFLKSIRFKSPPFGLAARTQKLIRRILAEK